MGGDARAGPLGSARRAPCVSPLGSVCYSCNWAFWLPRRKGLGRPGWRSRSPVSLLLWDEMKEEKLGEGGLHSRVRLLIVRTRPSSLLCQQFGPMFLPRPSFLLHEESGHGGSGEALSWHQGPRQLVASHSQGAPGLSFRGWSETFSPPPPDKNVNEGTGEAEQSRAWGTGVGKGESQLSWTGHKGLLSHGTRQAPSGGQAMLPRGVLTPTPVDTASGGHGSHCPHWGH